MRARLPLLAVTLREDSEQLKWLVPEWSQIVTYCSMYPKESHGANYHRSLVDAAADAVEPDLG